MVGWKQHESMGITDLEKAPWGEYKQKKHMAKLNKKSNKEALF